MKLFPFLNREPQPLQLLEKHDLPQEDIRLWHDFIQQANPRELVHANPLYLAERLKWSEQKLLDLLTISTAERLWNLEWDSYCGACGNLVQKETELAHLHPHQICAMCGNEEDIQLDEEVVARASVADTWRRLDKGRADDADFRTQIDKRLGRLPSLHLINRPLFRQILGEQILPPNQSLGVGKVSVFFSDLKSSTLLYQRLGDATAYRLVREHFDIVFNAVERHGGSAVKTIGDGVMGTFFNSASALQGVVESIQGLEELNRRNQLTGEERLRLKVGLHTGACIVVTLNSRLDYFGSTVNIAARLSDLAQGGEILLSTAVLEDPAAQSFAEQSNCDPEESVQLRGVLQKVEICKLRP